MRRSRTPIIRPRVRFAVTSRSPDGGHWVTRIYRMYNAAQVANDRRRRRFSPEASKSRKRTTRYILIYIYHVHVYMI